MNPLRILHVIGVMDRGGTETWLLHILRNIDRKKLQMDFLVHTNEAGAYDAEIQALGGRVFHCPYPESPIRYAKRFIEIARQYGPFDVIHSHLHHFSGFVLALARAARIPSRVSHSHNYFPHTDNAWARRVYRHVGTWFIDATCTHGLAASVQAASDLFGEKWSTDPRFEVLHCGIDMEPFLASADSVQVRSEFGFESRNLVVGHVGRFEQQKNHEFLIEIACRAVPQDSDVRFLLVGDGPLRPSLEAKVRRLGLTEHIVFAGSRADVPRLMLGAFDRFLFPSLHEGLGLALIEAQAAGLPCTISTDVPCEADVIPQLITRLPLSLSPEAWAFHILQDRTPTIPDALAQVVSSPFNIVTSARRLASVYAA